MNLVILSEDVSLKLKLILRLNCGQDNVVEDNVGAAHKIRYNTTKIMSNEYMIIMCYKIT